MSHPTAAPVAARPYRESDAPAIHALIHATIDAVYTGVYPPRAVEFFKHHHSLADIRQRAREGCTLVIEQDGLIVATGTLKGDYVGGVFVDPGRQRSGHGRTIMVQLEQRARDAGLGALTLDVSLPSRGFYERLGYRLSDVIHRDVGEGQALDYWTGRKVLFEPPGPVAPDGKPAAPAPPAADPLPAQTLYVDSDDAVSALDELSLWAAPFGLRLLEAVELGRNLRVLDVGFGTGFPLLELAARLGASSQVCGLDPWLAGHRRTRFKLRQLGLPNVTLVEGVAEAMPFEDGSFDRVVSNNGFNNVTDMAQAFREAGRVARAGAQLVFTVNLDGSMRELHTVFEAIFADMGLPEATAALRTHIYSRRKPLEEILAHVCAAGFELKTVRHDSFALRYADADALFAHPFVRLAFLDGWRAAVPDASREPVFSEVKRRLEVSVEASAGISLSIPFVTVTARKSRGVAAG